MSGCAQAAVYWSAPSPEDTPHWVCSVLPLADKRFVEQSTNPAKLLQVSLPTMFAPEPCQILVLGLNRVAGQNELRKSREFVGTGKPQQETLDKICQVGVPNLGVAADAGACWSQRSDGTNPHQTQDLAGFSSTRAGCRWRSSRPTSYGPAEVPNTPANDTLTNSGLHGSKSGAPDALLSLAELPQSNGPNPVPNSPRNRIYWIGWKNSIRASLRSYGTWIYPLPTTKPKGRSG